MKIEKFVQSVKRFNANVSTLTKELRTLLVSITKISAMVMEIFFVVSVSYYSAAGSFDGAVPTVNHKSVTNTNT